MTEVGGDGEKKSRVENKAWEGGSFSSQPSYSGACKYSAKVAQISYWCMDVF
jgi:hypothetical protein